MKRRDQVDGDTERIFDGRKESIGKIGKVIDPFRSKVSGDRFESFVSD